LGWLNVRANLSNPPGDANEKRARKTGAWGNRRVGENREIGLLEHGRSCLICRDFAFKIDHAPWVAALTVPS
jgi:hypothetical protein